MTMPNPNDYRGVSLDKVESVGTFRCPHCREVEEENERLKKRIDDLEQTLHILKTEHNEDL